MEISGTELRQLLTDAAEAGARKALIDCGQLSPIISKSEAYRLYSRKTVDRWIAEGLVKVNKDGTNTSKTRLSRHELTTLATSSSRASWFKSKA